MQLPWNLKRRTLARDLSAGLTAAVAVVLFALGAAAFLALTLDANRRLNERSNERADRLADVLSLPLWNLDYDSVNRIGNAYADSAEVVHIYVRDEAGGEFHFGPQPPPEHDFVLQRQIQHFGQPVGQAQIYVSAASVQSLRWGILLVTLAAVITSIGTIVLVTQLILRRFLERPLRPVLEGIEQISEGRYGHRIAATHREDVDQIIAGINAMTESIQQRDAEIRESEQKYRFLVEDSSDIIFALNDTGEIVTVNQAVRRLLGRSQKAVIGRPFSELLYRSGDIQDLMRLERIAQAMQRIADPGASTKIMLELATAQNEPREMLVQFEMVLDEGGRAMTFGKAMLPSENLLARQTERESRKFVIGNYLSASDLVLDAITSNLAAHSDEDTAYAIKAGVKEILTNAIEHGNLAISYEEKNRATSDGSLYRLIKERQAQSPYKDRTVTVYYSLHPDRVVYVIRDQGAGFDHRAMMQREEVEATRFHGRGILMARGVFDVIRYNPAGNQVTLSKRFGRHRGASQPAA